MTQQQQPAPERLPSVQSAPEPQGLMTPQLRHGPATWRRVTSALATWVPAEPIPTGITPATVSTAISAISEALKPGGEDAAEAVFKGVYMMAEALGLNPPPEQIRALRTLYRAALADLPADVLSQAVQRVIKGWRWRSLPAPGDVRKEAEAIMDGWRLEKLRLETAAMILRRDKQGARMETRAEVEARRAARWKKDVDAYPPSGA